MFDNSEYFPYELNQYLLPRTEHDFFLVLKDCVDPKYFICPKVALKDLFSVHTDHPDHDYFRDILKQKHIDFLICASHNLAPVLAIEVDDEYVDDDTIFRDNFFTDVFYRAGLPLVRFPSQPIYDKNSILAKLIPFLP